MANAFLYMLQGICQTAIKKVCRYLLALFE